MHVEGRELEVWTGAKRIQGSPREVTQKWSLTQGTPFEKEGAGRGKAGIFHNKETNGARVGAAQCLQGRCRKLGSHPGVDVQGLKFPTSLYWMHWGISEDSFQNCAKRHKIYEHGKI